ncbi:hypothetical protein CFB48_35915 [Burkholderia sp. AU33647]|nr:hypothetical protein CFB48_35915 [Burkholderia sp. AU33647]
MRQQRRGHIFNPSSPGGLVVFAATGCYHATKFAVKLKRSHPTRHIPNDALGAVTDEFSPHRGENSGYARRGSFLARLFSRQFRERSNKEGLI